MISFLLTLLTISLQLQRLDDTKTATQQTLCLLCGRSVGLLEVIIDDIYCGHSASRAKGSISR